MDPKSLYSRQAASIGRAVPSRPSARDAAVVAELRSRLSSDDKPVSLAELSVGDGSLSVALAEAFPDARLTLVDISREHLEAAAALVADPNRVTTIEASLPEGFDALGSSHHDAVVALDILEHVFDVFGFVRHCARVLRPGGVLALRTPNIAYLRRRVELLLGRLPVTASWFGPRHDFRAWRETYGWDGSHLHYFTWPTLRRLLHEEGFVELTVADPGTRLEGLRRRAPGVLCGNLLVVGTRSPQ